MCDRDGVPAYLESSKERNVDFYSRFGFRVKQEVRIPGGPDVADVAGRSRWALDCAG